MTHLPNEEAWLARNGSLLPAHDLDQQELNSKQAERSRNISRFPLT